MGEAYALRMLGEEGWKPTAAEGMAVGFVKEVVPHDQLLLAAQRTAEGWIDANKTRSIGGVLPADEATIKALKTVNLTESLALAQSFFGVPFLQNQEEFMARKGKSKIAWVFKLARWLRPVWYGMSGAEHAQLSDFTPKQ
jgi:enoyl-CoA hydratase/carnithine racemase